jgi:hypothetical protein
MRITSKAAIVLSLGLGVFGSAALYGQANGTGLRGDTAPQPVITEPEFVPTPVAMDVGSAYAVTAPAEVAPILPLDAPNTPPLANPGAALPERLTQVDAAQPVMTDQPLSPFGLPCGLTVTTETLPAATVALDIMAPCQPNARVVVEHSGLNLTGQTDAMGILTMDIPAFESPAFFTVRMPDGATASALSSLPDIAGYTRVGVQWQEDRALELHAMEFGATYGDPGHIWRDNPGFAARAENGEGGFMTYLGTASVENPMLAEIYTFPRDTLNNDGTVRLTIEAEVTLANCGQDTVARTLESDGDGNVAVIELTFTVPGCDAVGEFLVLQNLLQDLRVAAN